jgi:hypothetical protein
MLDNDLIRLNQKVETVLQLRGKTIDKERILAEQDINEDPFKKRREEEAAKREAEKKQLESEKSIGGAKGRKATAEEIKNASGD